MEKLILKTKELNVIQYIFLNYITVENINAWL